MERELGELIDAIRVKAALLSVDAVTIATPFGDFQCHAALDLGAEQFAMEISIPSEAFPRPLDEWLKSRDHRGAGIGRHDFWKATGQLPALGPFTALDLIPPGSSTEKVGYWRASLTFDRLTLCSHPLTAEQKKEQEEEWRALLQRLGQTPSETSNDPPSNARIRMSARIIGLRSPFLNERTSTIQTNPFLKESSSWKTDTFVGESSIGTFALIQHGEDLDIHLRYERPDLGIKQIDEDERKFDALLQSVGLSHAINPLPCYFEHTQNTHVINRWIRPMFRPNRPSLTPFWEGMCHCQPRCATFVTCAFEFFLRQTSKQKGIEQLLAIFHETDHSDIPFDVKLLSICTLVEGLVTLLLDERLSPPEAFNSVKNAAITWAVEKDKSSQDQDQGYGKRLVGYLKGWGYSRPEEKWRRLCEVLNLPWETCFKEIHQLWQEMRNPLSHGSHKLDNEQDAERQLLAVSKLGGAFNTMVAAHIGYHGPIQVSPYENRELVIHEMR